MIYSSLIIAALLQTSAFAADQREKQHVRRTAVEDHEEPNVPHKHQPRGEKSSSMVTYFTMGGKEEKKKKKKKSHDGKSGAKEARIVGGSQSDPGEFPYYGKRCSKWLMDPIKIYESHAMFLQSTWVVAVALSLPPMLS